MRSRRTVIWATLALIGVTASVAIAFATSRISNQHIGLSSQQPAVATQALAPTDTQVSTVKSKKPRVSKKRRDSVADPAPSPSVTFLPVGSNNSNEDTAAQPRTKEQQKQSGSGAERDPIRTVTNVVTETPTTPSPNEVTSVPTSDQSRSDVALTPNTNRSSSESPAPTTPVNTVTAPVPAPKTTTADD